MGEKLGLLGKHQEGAGCFARARAVGAAHGLFSVECKACMGLGAQAMADGKPEEAVELLQNALSAAGPHPLHPAP